MITAVVPLKDLSQAKSRLAAALTPEERAAVAVRLAERTVSVLRASGVVRTIVLAGPDPGLARRFGVDWYPDRGSLNATLREAAGRISGAMLIVTADLPLLTTADVQALAAEGSGRSVTVGAAADGGTAALVLRPPDVIAPHFGERSAAHHIWLAERAGVPVRVLHRPGLARDLDTPADLAELGSVVPLIERGV